MIFEIIPYMLIRIQFRGVRRKKEDSQLPAGALNKFTNLCGTMNGAIIENQKHRFLRVGYKTLAKFYKYCGINAALRGHELHRTAWADCRDQIHLVSGACCFHHRCFSAQSPGCP
jgi:hypothetical protein